MIIAGSLTATRAWEDDRYSDGGTATSSQFPQYYNSPTVYVVSYYGEPAPIEPNVETKAERRRRLSLEAIDRYRRAGLRFVLRVVSVWSRVLYVARTCAQSERWRVLA